jgi:serine protease Do
VRVRLAAIEPLNLKVFDFDYDLTFWVMFLSPDERVYSRYGGRCEKDADERQSLAGLRSTMESVLAEHRSRSPRFAPRETGKPFFIADIAPSRGLGRCIHCHQAKEVIYDRMDREGKWNLDMAFRYPPPDNIGFVLDVDRSNVIKHVDRTSPAADAGLQPGDQITSLNRVPIHSFGDAGFALDRAPKRGAIVASWRRGDQEMSGKITLFDRWRRTDISWRPSLQGFVASPRVFGDDLTAKEREKHGLTAKHLAFWQKSTVPAQAAKAGIRPGDLILGFDDQTLEMDAYEFLLYVRSNYVKGESVIVNAIRDDRRLRLRMTLE